MHPNEHMYPQITPFAKCSEHSCMHLGRGYSAIGLDALHEAWPPLPPTLTALLPPPMVSRQSTQGGLTEKVMSAVSIFVMVLLALVFAACVSLCFASDVLRLTNKEGFDHYNLVHDPALCTDDCHMLRVVHCMFFTFVAVGSLFNQQQFSNIEWGLW